MKVDNVLGLISLTALSLTSEIIKDYEKNDYYVLHLDPSTSPNSVAARLGFEHQRPLGILTDHHLFRAEKSSLDIAKTSLRDYRRRKRHLGERDALDGVLLSVKQFPRNHLEKRIIPPNYNARLRPRIANGQNQDVAAIERRTQLMQKLQIEDPIFIKQWHLFNTIQVGHDINVTGLWLEGVTGNNATVAIIDDGVDMNSIDLKDNYFPEGSWDFNFHKPTPKPDPALDDQHGTRCAGEVAAVRNEVCGVGVAYNARVAGIRILSKQIDDEDEAKAMIHEYDLNQIYSCSWGPRDDGMSMEAPGVLIRRAILQGIQQGRQGLGSIYVFASGNGAASDDNCNFDGYTNSIYSITVGAIDRAGNHPYYSELCSAQLVVTYSSGDGDSIQTTDIGVNKCATGHGGTSAAAPLAAGIFALVMQVRPDLTWRDLQYLAMETAVYVDAKNADWQDTANGRRFSHMFGYGKINSFAIVQRARTWEKIKPQAWYFSPWLHVKKDIPDGEHDLVLNFEVTEDMLKDANLGRLEHVTITMNLNHTRRGDVSVDLISPLNVVSHIATARKNDAFRGGYDDWTFMSVAHWGESGVGKWVLKVRDTKKNGHIGTMVDWRMKLWGESIDASQAKLLPMPNETDDEDHDQTVTTVTPVVSTSSLGAHPEPSDDGSEWQKPTDHPDRPTKPGSKPGSGSQGKPSMPSSVQESPASTSTSSWIDKTPSFGASKTASIWIYGALVFIVAFCIGLGIYLWLAHRRLVRNTPRDDYEFELLDEDEMDENPAGEKYRGNNRGGRRTRSGELYDAFAEGSEDDELEESDESGTYRDTFPPNNGVADEDEHYIVGEESDEEDVGVQAKATTAEQASTHGGSH